MMYVLEFFTYHLRPYGEDSKLHFSGELVNSTDWDFTKLIKELPVNQDGNKGKIVGRNMTFHFIFIT